MSTPYYFTPYTRTMNTPTPSKSETNPHAARQQLSTAKPLTLVTGASGGIGAALALQAADHGHDLLLVARNADKLAALQQKLEATRQTAVFTLPLDLARPEAPQEILDWLVAHHRTVNRLINNAGLGDFGTFAERPLEKQLQMIQLNITALTALTHKLLPQLMKQPQARILNLSSTAAFQPGPLMAVYYATKHYVQAFSEALANELKNSPVTVTALCPGPTASGFQQAADLQESKLVKDKKLPTAQEVAQYGFRAMEQGKTTAIHGLQNRLLAFSTRLLPRKMVTNLVRKMSERAS